MSYTVTDCINALITILHKKYTDITHMQSIAWWIVEAITQKSKLELITHHQSLSKNEYLKALSYCQRHTQENYPLQYLLGSVEFCGLTLCVEPPTLIPRPETEEWVHNLIQQLQPFKDKPLTILDMCTGSGCIGLALAAALPQATIIAVDIAPTALALAHKNAQKNKLTNITFLQSNLSTNIPQEITFDLIVSNPPYISEEEFKNMELIVTQWEDKQALVADEEGLKLIRTLITDAPRYLKQDTPIVHTTIPKLLIEIGHLQGETIEKLFSNAGFDTITIVQDLYGKDRIAMFY